VFGVFDIYISAQHHKTKQEEEDETKYLMEFDRDFTCMCLDVPTRDHAVSVVTTKQ
jgi:hypothetical protein